MIRYSFKDGVQKIEELCEHCGEPIKDLHISEITTLAPNDPRTIKIRNADNDLIDVKRKEEFIAEKTASYIREGLLDDDEAVEFRSTNKLKYGVRPEAMCSQSIDSVAGVTASFCYKTTNANFLAKTSGSTTFNAKFNAASEKRSTELGRKVGIDRKGNIIRMRSEKNLDEPESRLKYHGQFKESWFRALKPTIQKTYLEAAQECKTLIKLYGEDACEDGSVMSNFRNVDEFKTYMDRNCR